MAEKGLWFDDGEEHGSGELAEFFAGFTETGVNVYGNPNSLLVEATTEMNVKVNSGIAYINGRYYNSGGDLNFTLTSAIGSIKYVRIVVRVDLSAKTIVAAVKEGGSLPSLTRDNSVHEISLAKITIPAGASSITSAMIVDERSNNEVCGFFRFAGHEAQRVPSGTVEFFAAQNPPAGWLICNGSLISRSVYSDLFNVVGTTFGAGDGSTTFALPDLRGEFIRGWDNGRGIDAGRAFGSAQGSQSNVQFAYYVGYTTNDNDRNANAKINTTEVRPRNIALLPIIKI